MTGRRRDVLVCAALVVATSIYLAWWPHDFDGFDEGMYLYEAKRVLDGDVMYRDFFQILTPAWFYLVAGCYALFGVSLETARAAMALVHAGIVAMIFLIARRIGLPVTVAALLALLHLTIGYPSCSITTPHWFSTLLYLVIAAVALRSPCVTPRRAFAWGTAIGLLTLVQQQKGSIMALGVGLIVAMDLRGALNLSERRVAPRRLALGMVAYLCGIGVTVGPVMLTFVALAGFDNVWNALVVYPVLHYPRIHRNIPWGFYVPGVIPWGFVIQWLAGVIPIAAVVLLWRVVRGAGANQRQLIVLLVLSFFGLLSVVYNRTYLHLALAAPLWFLLGGALVSSFADRWRPHALPRVAMQGVALLLIVLCVGQLAATLRARRAALPSPSMTAFGRIDTYDDIQPKLIEQLSGLLREQPGTEMFVYPANPGLYLITGLRNPTRFQIVLPGYTAAREVSEIIDTLEKRRVELVVNHLYPGPGPSPLLTDYLRDHYEFAAKFGGNVVYRRKVSERPRPVF